MRYALAIFLPPVAVLMTGRAGSAFINLFLTLLFWVPGVLHAWLVISEHKADKRTDKLIKAAAYRGR